MLDIKTVPPSTSRSAGGAARMSAEKSMVHRESTDAVCSPSHQKAMTRLQDDPFACLMYRNEDYAALCVVQQLLQLFEPTRDEPALLYKFGRYKGTLDKANAYVESMFQDLDDLRVPHGASHDQESTLNQRFSYWHISGKFKSFLVLAPPERVSERTRVVRSNTDMLFLEQALAPFRTFRVQFTVSPLAWH